MGGGGGGRLVFLLVSWNGTNAKLNFSVAGHYSLLNCVTGNSCICDAQLLIIMLCFMVIKNNRYIYYRSRTLPDKKP